MLCSGFVPFLVFILVTVLFFPAFTTLSFSIAICSWFITIIYNLFVLELFVLFLLCIWVFWEDFFVNNIHILCVAFLSCLECQLSFVAVSSYDMTFLFADSFWVGVLLLLLLLFFYSFSLSLYTLSSSFCHGLGLAPWSSLFRIRPHIGVLGLQLQRYGYIANLVSESENGWSQGQRERECGSHPLSRLQFDSVSGQSSRHCLIKAPFRNQVTKHNLWFHSLSSFRPLANEHIGLL